MIGNYQSGDNIESRKDQVYELAKLSIKADDPRFIWLLSELWEKQKFRTDVQSMLEKKKVYLMNI